MAKDKKLVESITSRDVDFAQWYTDVVKKAELTGYTSVKGCMVFKPAGYAIWENIQHELDRRFKETGVQNVYLPMLIPESLLDMEKDHVEGFAPEVAWVTMGGLTPLQERMCIRPTSETLFCDLYAKDVQSYRDLPSIISGALFSAGRRRPVPSCARGSSCGRRATRLTPRPRRPRSAHS